MYTQRNQEFLKNIRSIQSTIEETLELLQKTKHRVERIFPRRGNAVKKLCNRSRRFDSQCSFTERLDKPKDMIYYNRDFMKYHDAPNNKKNTVPGHDCYFAKLASFEKEYCEKGELHMEYRKMSCQEKNRKLCECCRATDFLSPSPAASAPRPYPDYGKPVPDFHYLPSTKTPQVAVNLTSGFQRRAQLKPRCFNRVSSKQGIKRQSKS